MIRKLIFWTSYGVVVKDKKLLGSPKNYDHKKEEKRVCYCLAGNLSFRFECQSCFKNAWWSLGVCSNPTWINSIFRSGLVDKLVTHANIKGFCPTSLCGDCRGLYASFDKEKSSQKKIISKDIFLKFKNSCPLPPSAKHELIGVISALLLQQIKPQASVAICLLW